MAAGQRQKRRGGWCQSSMAICLAEVVRDRGSHLSHPSIASSQSTGSGRKYCYLAAAADATAEVVAHSGCTQHPAIRAWGPAVVFVGTGAVPDTVRLNQDWDDSRQESGVVLYITCCHRAIQERALGSAGRGWAAKGARRESDVRRHRRANVLVPGSTATLTRREGRIYSLQQLQLGRSSGRMMRTRWCVFSVLYIDRTLAGPTLRRDSPATKLSCQPRLQGVM